MRRSLPLNALRIFEVAARTGSYAEAGVELGLTHGAVSRQIALLEAWLGQRLFVRTGRRMTATPAARVFAAEVSLSFDRVTAAAEACGRPSARQILRVSAPTTFALRWLIPHLEHFHAARPQVEVTVTTTTTLHDELRGGFDIAVRRGSADPGAWPQYRAVSFLPEADTLIVSPTLFERSPLHQPADIASHVLLGSETRPGDWANWWFWDWCRPLACPPNRRGRGRLLTPFSTILVPRTGYLALVPFDASKTSVLTSFIDWLVAEGTG
jgi:LysR family transcriptional regulator, glycine cleavage system transcriptional activator